MASAHCSFSSLLAPSTTRRTPPLIIVASNASHRKNYLRPKILKTLTKPCPPAPPLLPPPPPPPPQQPILCPQEHDLRVEVPAADTHGEDIAGAVGEPDKLEDMRVSEATAEHNGFFGNGSASDIFKYGGTYLVGAFVFQTICSFWILGNYRSDQNNGDSEVSDGNGKTVPVTSASNAFYTEDQLGMEKKIEEIRLMAREARRIESEKKGEEEEDPEIDDENAVSKEIGARLLKLQNRIISNKDSSAALNINARGNSAAGVGRDGDNKIKNVNQGNEALSFKKRFKFKSPSTKSSKTPKGFSGTQDRRKDRASNGTTQGYGYEDKKVNQEDVAPEITPSVPSEERGKFVDDESGAILNHGENSEEKMETPDIGSKSKSIDKGGVQETSVGVSSLEVIQSRDSRELRTQNPEPQGFVEENQDIGPFFEKDNVHSINGSSRHGIAKKNSAANRVKVKQANTKTDMWWMNLRYVLVILMQRGSNEEGQKGLYSLNFTSKEQEQSDDSYTVAFEDQADANNFCFLLESFFEDLGDFSANAVPMSIQELNEEIISHATKVVVVKKRQLQLYAGQPLSDVEMALCSIIEEDQNVP